MENLEHITEDAVILRHTELCVSETALSQKSFIEDRLLPVLAKAGYIKSEPRKLDAFAKWQATQRRYISYMFNGERDIPLKYKWLWVNSLPEPYKTACKKELQAMTGSLFVEMPGMTDDRGPSTSRLSDLMREFSEVVRDSRPAQDGGFGPEDSTEETQLYADQLADLLEAGFAELLAVQQGTGIMPRRQIMALVMNDFEEDQVKVALN